MACKTLTEVLKSLREVGVSNEDLKVARDVLKKVQSTEYVPAPIKMNQTEGVGTKGFDKNLHKKIEGILKRLYPEIKLEYTEDEIQHVGADGSIMNQEESSNLDARATVIAGGGNHNQFTNNSRTIGIELAYLKSTNLSKIGSIKEYTKYLHTVFPTSLLQGTYFHNTGKQARFSEEKIKKAKIKYQEKVESIIGEKVRKIRAFGFNLKEFQKDLEDNAPSVKFIDKETRLLLKEFSKSTSFSKEIPFTFKTVYTVNMDEYYINTTKLDEEISLANTPWVYTEDYVKNYKDMGARDGLNYGNGLYFSKPYNKKDIGYSWYEREGLPKKNYTIVALLNVQKPIGRGNFQEIAGSPRADFMKRYNVDNTNINTKLEELHDVDAVFGTAAENETVVWNEDNIHILGSPKDVKGFTEWKKSNKLDDNNYKFSPLMYQHLSTDGRAALVNLLKRKNLVTEKNLNHVKQIVERIVGSYNAYNKTFIRQALYAQTYHNNDLKTIEDGLYELLTSKNTFNEKNIETYKAANLFMQKQNSRIKGQANIEAKTVLINSLLQSQDTLPHEYAHHYIAWFRDAPIVQEAIKKWGSEEALVQAIGEQAVKQKGEAYGWWKQFTKWVQNKFNKLDKSTKEELKNMLTDSFLLREDLYAKPKSSTNTMESISYIKETSGRISNKLIDSIKGCMNG